MQTILALLPEGNEVRSSIFRQLINLFESKMEFQVACVASVDAVMGYLQVNPRVSAVLYDFDTGGLDLCHAIQRINIDLPIFAFTDKDTNFEADLRTLKYNLHFFNYHSDQSDAIYYRIVSTIAEYIEELMPPFTKALFDYAEKNKYSYCTPGHADGTAFLNSPLGTLFYDFYGANIFKSDLSISMEEMGSLLDHTGYHRQAEEYIAKSYDADHSYIVTNGTSTANKMVAMHVLYDGATVLVDRNCHKSITHVLMMNNVYPIYLMPSRNFYGIIGGISTKQFSAAAIDKERQHLEKTLQKKLDDPVYAVVTNSTYDGLLYDTDYLKKALAVPNLHFDGAWIAYAPFSKIYQGKYGVSGPAVSGKTIYETFSTHKLLAAFSQSSMIHIKDSNFDTERFNDSYMMHSSTSPFYPMIASTETAVAMMRGAHGERLLNAALQESFKFRLEIERLRKENEDIQDGWFYDILQPPNVGREVKCFPLENEADWHHFSGDVSHMSLDPIKITLLTPGISGDQYDLEFGIPACLIAKFLDYQGIVVEKTGPYSLLFLFGIGSDRSKSLKLLNELTSFKKAFDDDQKIEKVLPNLYKEAPRLYKKYTIQKLAQEIHALYIEKNLCGLMYRAYGMRAKMVMTPYQARQAIIKDQVKKVALTNLAGEICSEMILPYPPGIPLLLPGESITPESKDILDFLLVLCEIGDKFPGFETNIHGVSFSEDGAPFTYCLAME